MQPYFKEFISEHEKYQKGDSFIVDDEIREYLINCTKTAFEVAKMITRRRTSIYLYGGTVRNLLLGIGTSEPDYDFIGDFDIDNIERDFPGLVTGRWDDVATIRLKIGSTIFDFTMAENIFEKLSQNDITSSNLCMSESGEIIDYFGAIESLAKKEIKILNPDLKIMEDPVRILRVFRFAAELGFSIDESTLSSVIKNAHLLCDAKDVDNDLWQIIALDHDTRMEVLKSLHQYGVDRYLNFPDMVLETINVYALEREIQRCKQIDEIVEMFNCDIYLVGGAVRDFVWGKRMNDLDFEVHLPIEEMITILEANGFKKCEDYHTSEHQYYVSAFSGVVGAVIDGVDVHLTEVITTDLPTLINQGDVNFSCCVYDVKTRKIQNPETIKKIQNKELYFCNSENALSSPTIIINALKQISRVPDILIPQETEEIIKRSIPSVVNYIRENPNFKYLVSSFCGNINSEQVYGYFDHESQDIFDNINRKKSKLRASTPQYTSVTVQKLSDPDRDEIIALLKMAYGKEYDSTKVFSENINSVVFERKGGKIISCCLIDSERMYSVAATDGAGWAGIIAELAKNNYNVWGTVDCNNPKIQALCSIAGLNIETKPNIIRKILESKTNKYKDVEIFELNGMTVFKKKNKKGYPQVLVRS